LAVYFDKIESGMIAIDDVKGAMVGKQHYSPFVEVEEKAADTTVLNG